MQTVKTLWQGEKIKISKVAGEYLLISNTWLSSRISKGKAFLGAEICMWIETRWKVSALRYNALQSEDWGTFNSPWHADRLLNVPPALGYPFPSPNQRLSTTFAKLPGHPDSRLEPQAGSPTGPTAQLPATGPTNRPKTSSVKQNRRRKPSPLKYQCKDHTYFCRKALTNTELQSCDASCLFLLFWRNGEPGILKESG